MPNYGIILPLSIPENIINNLYIIAQQYAIWEYILITEKISMGEESAVSGHRTIETSVEIIPTNSWNQKICDSLDFIIIYDENNKIDNYTIPTYNLANPKHIKALIKNFPTVMKRKIKIDRDTKTRNTTINTIQPKKINPAPMPENWDPRRRRT